MTTEHEIEVVTTPPLTVEQVVERTGKIHALLKGAMTEGVHWGTIPGCGDKPNLFQAGAQRLAMMFHLTPRVKENRIDLGNGHREYETTVELVDQATGVVVSVGVAVCSTMEAKYRYRSGPKESTGELVPKEYWDIRQTDPFRALNLIGGPGFQALKDEATGAYTIHVKGERVEHDNPADYYNTVRKMAFKRAFVHAVINATSASDIFDQDLDPDDLGNQAPDDKAIDRPQSKQANGGSKSANGSGQGKQSAGSDSPNGGSARVVTKKQAGRFFAKCKGGPRSDEQASEYLANLGFASCDALTTDVYDRACAWADGAD